MNSSNEPPLESKHESSPQPLEAFGQIVLQNTNLALMYLGQVPHPQSGERVHDFEAAKVFIDQLEMLAIKTKGNLTREEEKFLQQSLMHLRLTFVHEIENPPKPEPATKPEPEAAPQPTPESTPQAEKSDEPESHKRFSKKF